MRFTREITDKFPGLHVMVGRMSGVNVRESKDADLEAFKQEVSGIIRSKHTIEDVKNDPDFRAYRDFFWSIGVDPTKTRPASEALVRRILSGGKLPAINTAVDAYNMASASSSVPIAAFDDDMIEGELLMRFALEGEKFRGIGMKDPIDLKPNQIIITDSKKIIAVYPYRDSDDTKVTADTKSMRVIVCGVPGISNDKLEKAYETCAENLGKYAGATASEGKLFP
ncbi:hypothetical protein CUJ83_00450 [Methanocella sp. CWC-04]|uniref:B3/B4 tRNA-binding domain-containing protein n=1 Tax=Methanooceanicella nereidis TaxID=2052831 RepID=A0AAP2RAT2_9EURY|nr:phenylalanine--tRNA ligase beta subunit-related protein [Methanocella sp. CWC-04]MCD1293466.1 hypothetical protein [Methanocella sp. CWC-04]